MTQNCNKYIDINFQEEPYKSCEEAFNLLCQTMYPDIKQYTHIELHALCNTISTSDWKKFLLHEKVKEWFFEEQQLDIRQKTNKLIMSADKNSTAQNQTLTSLLNTLSKNETKDNKVIIIYNCFTPLTEDEKVNKNVTKINDIPNGIKNAIQIINDI